MSDAIHPAAERSQGTPPPTPEPPWRVLVVDDDRVDRMAVRRGLARAGSPAVVDEAEGVPEALAMLASAHYDCVFLDYNIPGGDGLTLLQGMRQAGLDFPVVVLTGHGDEQVAVQLMKAGAVDYMPKVAATPERLASSVRYAVELSRVAAETRRAQQQLHASAERARFLAEASAVLASSLDVRSTLDQVMQLAVPLLGEYCYLYLVDEGGEVAAVTSAHAEPRKMELTREIQRRFRPAKGHPTSGISEVIRTGRTKLSNQLSAPLVESVAATPDEKDAYAALDPGKVLYVPVSARTVLGAAVFCRTPSQPDFTMEEVALAEDLARRAATALDNARLFEEAQRARARTERLQRVTARLAAVFPQQEVASIFVSEVREAFGADTAWISLLTPDGTELVAAADVGFAPEVIARFSRLPIEVPMPVRDCIRDRRPLWFASKAEMVEAYPSLAEQLYDVDQEAVAFFPLSVVSSVLGAITIGFQEPRTFGAEDLALATALAQQCAQALERARLYDAERASRAAAEEANRAKSDFLARMSHDLRTPLNAIGGYAQLIEEGIFGIPSDGQRQSLDRIRRAQQHLLMLINDILSFAKLEAGQVNLQLRPVKMSEVFTELRPLVETQAQTKRLRLRLEEGDTDAEVVADRGRLAQILVNLLTNAIKFTEPDGRIDVQCGVLPNTVEIRVCDTGVGIPAERLEAIFDPFIQVKGTAVEPREGVGLGLAISRELARLMHGELTVRSEVGRGSTFTLTLPRAATSEACRVGA